MQDRQTIALIPEPSSPASDAGSVAIIAPEPVAIGRLIEVDRAASSLFEPTGLLSPEALMDTVGSDDLLSALNNGWLLAAVIDDAPAAGFVMASRRGNGLYIDQISVDPAYGRRGIGRALMQGIENLALQNDLREMTLSTFRDLPWNAPFYAGLGFRPLRRRDLEPFMLTIEAAQAPFMDVSRRTFMRKRLRKPLFRGRRPA